MKKVLISFFIIGIVVLLGIVSSKYFNEDDNLNSDKALISYYVETGEGTGVYEKQEGATWPEGYVLNEEKSSCDNGSILSWDSDTNSVIVTASKEDSCKVYFDVYTYETMYVPELVTILDQNDMEVFAIIIDAEGNEVYSVIGSEMIIVPYQYSDDAPLPEISEKLSSVYEYVKNATNMTDLTPDVEAYLESINSNKSVDEFDMYGLFYLYLDENIKDMVSEGSQISLKLALPLTISEPVVFFRNHADSEFQILEITRNYDGTVDLNISINFNDADSCILIYK